jgi:uncharacterized protein DUF4082
VIDPLPKGKGFGQSSDTGTAVLFGAREGSRGGDGSGPLGRRRSARAGNRGLSVESLGERRDNRLKEARGTHKEGPRDRDRSGVTVERRGRPPHLSGDGHHPSAGKAALPKAASARLTRLGFRGEVAMQANASNVVRVANTLRALTIVALGLLPGACSSPSDPSAPLIAELGSALSTCSPSAPCSIWSTSATPAGSGTTTAVELGVKWQSTEGGFITGVRFYKDDSASTHTVNLWDASGDLLGRASTTSETSNGWQTATFAVAVPVAASTTYVASYFMPGGNFALDRPGFTSGVLNAPLEALTDGQAGGNGVYAYGASSSFPSNSIDASNYWVDILFSTTPPPTCTPSAPCSIW